MTKPVVYLRAECFFSIIFGAFDTGKKECLGILFGREDNRSGNKLIVENVCEIQSITKRTSGKAWHSKASADRIDKLLECAPAAFPFIGYFHSHTQWSSRESHYPLLSEGDFEDLKTSGAKLEIIVDIGKASGSCPWTLRQNGAIVGRLANWRVALHAYNIEGDTWQKLKLKVDPSVFLKLRRPTEK